MTIWDKRSSQMTIWWQPWSLCHRHHLCQRLGTIVLQTGLPSCPAMFSRTTFHNNIFWLISNWCRFQQTGPKANHLALGNSGCKHLFHLLLWHPTIRAVVHETLRMKYLDFNVGRCDNPISVQGIKVAMMSLRPHEILWHFRGRMRSCLQAPSVPAHWGLHMTLTLSCHLFGTAFPYCPPGWEEIQVLQLSIVRLSWILKHLYFF